MSRAIHRPRIRSYHSLSARTLRSASAKVRVVLFVLGLMGLWACGGSSPAPNSANPAAVSGNWQFSLSAPADKSFSGGLQGGFLLQDKGSVTGQVIYSMTISQPSSATCAGSAVVTGTLSAQTLNLTASAGSQTFSLTGTLSSDGSSITGTYSTIATPSCGTVQSGLPWSAKLMPSLSGSVQGYLHSDGSQNDPVLHQEFEVTGSLVQGPNAGTNSAPVTGTLNFQGYPCLDTVSVTGQISGNSAILQLIAANGLNVGQIGAQSNAGGSIGAVTFDSSAGGGYVLQGASGYGISTSACPANSATSPGDVGNICLAVGNSSACKEVLSLTPALLTFPAQALGSTPTTQQIKVTNTGATLLDGLQVSPTGNNFIPSDFNAIPNFTEQDSCSATPGSSFSLAPQQSCTVTISFSPQQSCPWQPSSPLPRCAPFQPVRPVQVPAPPALATSVTVRCPNCPTMPDDDSVFSVPVTGVGLSAIQPSTPELDFGPEDASLNEVSQPQSVTFTNQGNSAVQILPAMTTPPCGTSIGAVVDLPRPAAPGTVPGLQVVVGSPSNNPPTFLSSSHTVSYVCDIDQQSQKANFQIASDGCSGTLLMPQQSCSVAVVYAPQPGASVGGLDYFLQLNTLQCTTSTTADCEIDSGRFPVELKSALASPLRVSPGASLDFGTWPGGQTTYPPLTITLSNDKKLATPLPITFDAIVTKGDYVEVNDCGISLAPGSACTMSITFTPKITGFDQGSIVITYAAGQTIGLSQVIYLHGFGQ